MWEVRGGSSGATISLLCRKIIPKGLLFALTYSLLILDSVSAEARVYPDEYLVEWASNAKGSLSSLSSSSPFSVIRDVSHGTSVVIPLGSVSTYAVSADGTVPFDVEHSKCEEFLARADIVACSPNYQVSALGIPNDPQFRQQWGLSSGAGLGGPKGWDIQSSAEEVVVAILDTGIDYTHPDLAANMWRNTREVPGNGIDDDRNGFVDDVHGVNTATGTGDPFDDNLHGTHVAGIVGAVSNNGLGVSGVAGRVKLMALKFLNRSGAGSIADAVAAIDYLVAMKKRGENVLVANNSWGGAPFSKPLENAIRRAEQVGITFVAAAGNAANNNDLSKSYPADYDLDNVISVGAIDREGNLASFSNYGESSVDIVAPGVSILSTIPGAAYRSLSGTSMAAPHVAGALALAVARFGDLPPPDQRTLVMESGAYLPSLDGLVRAGRALKLERLLTPLRTPLPPIHVGGGGCSYETTSSSLLAGPELSGLSPVLVADELRYFEFDLPFNFPFYGELMTKGYISPNGVLYFRGSPSSPDFRAGEYAPQYSIAAVHTDLYAAESPYGVRLQANGDRVTVHWLMRHYTSRDRGEVSSVLSIYPDGSIEGSTVVNDPSLAEKVHATSLLGATGSSIGDAVVVETNATSLHAGFSMKLSPRCSVEGNVPALSKLKVTSAKRARKKRVFKSRSRSAIRIEGSGSGYVPVDVTINGVSCPVPLSIELQQGKGIVKGRLPSARKRSLSVEFRSGAIIQKIRVKRASRRRRRGRRLAASDIVAACSSLLSRFNR